MLRRSFIATTLSLSLSAGFVFGETHDARMVRLAYRWYPLVELKMLDYWPDHPYPRNIILAQIEKESLWNPRAQLKTSRELGRGFGQLTITPTMNIYDEVKGLAPALRSWDYQQDPFNPAKQIIAVLAKNAFNYRKCNVTFKGWSHVWGCTMSAYNGGLGGVNSDRRVCSNTMGCDPTKWFGGVEHTSLKQKVPTKGYGQSFFQINRGYARATVFERRVKYRYLTLGNS
jgi:hypothetical protein